MDCPQKKILYLQPGKKPTGIPTPGARHIVVPCGVCPPCKINHTQENTIRMWCEFKETEGETWFATFTYNDENLPPNNTLEKEAFQRFMKRLRKNFKQKIRYFACGEYGDKSGRAHYHAILFNLNLTDLKKIGKTKDGFQLFKQERLTKTWGMGHVTISPVTGKTALQYCAKYAQKVPNTKKAKKEWEITRPNQEPQFQLVSQRPGLGHDYFMKYKDNLYNQGQIHVRNANGVMKHYAIPKYFDRLLERYDPEKFEELTREREKFRPLLEDLIIEDGSHGFDTLKRRNQKAKAQWENIKRNNRKKGKF